MRLLTPITRTSIEVADDKAAHFLERGFVRAEAAAKPEPKKTAGKSKKKN